MESMSNLMLTAHPGGHPHPHDSDWLAVIADNPIVAVVAALAVAIIVSMVWRAVAGRD